MSESSRWLLVLIFHVACSILYVVIAFVYDEWINLAVSAGFGLAAWISARRLWQLTGRSENRRLKRLLSEWTK